MSEAVNMIDEAMGQLDQAMGWVPGAMSLEQIRRVVPGIPLPHFSERYLFGSTTLPTQKIISLAGPPGSCKTALAIYFAGLFPLYNPCPMVIVHNENKYPDTLPHSILRERVKYLRVYKDGINDIQTWMSLFGEISAKFAVPPWNRIAIPLLLDSFDGAQGEERARKIKKEGAPGRDWSELARVSKEWLPVFTKTLEKTAITCFFVHHLKSDGDDWVTSGGREKDFYASYTIYVVKRGDDDGRGTATGRDGPTKPTREGAINLYLRMQKDSYGPGGGWLPLTFQWWFDAAGMQQSRFAWHSATTGLLVTWLGSDEKKSVAKKSPIREIFSGDAGSEITTKSAGSRGTLYCCKEVCGKEFLDPEEFGEALEANAPLCRALNEACHITDRITVKEFWAEEDARAAAEEATKKGKGKKAEGPVVPPSPVVPGSDLSPPPNAVGAPNTAEGIRASAEAVKAFTKKKGGHGEKEKA